MAVFSIEIADADVQRVLDSVAGNYSRPQQVVNPAFVEGGENQGISELIDNPESKAAFANRTVRDFLRENVSAYERRLLKEAALQQLNTSITIQDAS